MDVIEHTMLHALDVGANYWSLWTEAQNVARYRERRPMAFEALERRIGYRVRPSWVWQRKRSATDELVVAFANDGVASVPGVLRVSAETRDGKALAGGSLDAGHPFAGRLRLASFLLPPGLGGSDVRLRAEIEVKGVRRPVRWACAQPLDADGALVVRLKKHDDAGLAEGGLRCAESDPRVAARRRWSLAVLRGAGCSPPRSPPPRCCGSSSPRPRARASRRTSRTRSSARGRSTRRGRSASRG